MGKMRASLFIIMGEIVLDGMMAYVSSCYFINTSIIMMMAPLLATVIASCMMLAKTRKVKVIASCLVSMTVAANVGMTADRSWQQYYLTAAIIAVSAIVSMALMAMTFANKNKDKKSK